MNLIRLIVCLLFILACAAVAYVAYFSPSRPTSASRPTSVGASRPSGLASTRPGPEILTSPGLGDCSAPGSFASAAGANSASEATLPIAPFGAAEIGWAAYLPLIAHEIGSACDAQSADFASHLARWQTAHGLAGAGILDPATINSMSTIWLLRRPFVLASRTNCPASPPAASLVQATPSESFSGKTILARGAALDAFRRMAKAAHDALGDKAAPIKITSAFRDPGEEAARCLDGSCGTPGKARCSAHRTGLAFDFYLGAAPGFDPFSTDRANRLFISQTLSYRWLVQNAGRFGFVNYPYEPWHWEWTGEAL